MLPMAFAVVLGGTISLLGTSTNLLASDVSRQLGFGSIELFDFTAIGIPIWLLGGLYMVLVSDRLLPDRGLDNKNELVGDLARAGYLTEVLIPEGSTLMGQTLHNSRLQRRFDVDGLELQRGAEIFSAPLADRVLQAADRLVLRCNKETLLRLQQEQTVILSPANEQEEAIEELSQPAVTAMRMVEVLLPNGSTLAGTSVRDLRFRQRYNANILAVRRGNQMLRELLGQLVLLEELEKDLPTTNRKWVALLLAVVIMVATGCLRPGELQRAIRWDVILLGSLLTETLSNGATVVLLIPIATELAKGLDLPPMASIALVLGDHLPAPLLGTYPSLANLDERGDLIASISPPELYRQVLSL